MSSFFPWMGGKSRIAKRLCQLLPEHKCYVEVFAGAANLLFAKEISAVEVLNDINSELINLFRIVRSHQREFMRELSLVVQGRTVFADYRRQPGLTDIQKAARSYFIMKAAFGGKGGTSHPDFGYGTTGRARFCRKMFAAINRCHKRLDGVYVENLNFEDCLRRYDRPHTVFYCDPPYLDVGGYKEQFRSDDHDRLAAIMNNIKGKFLLTINNHPKIRALYRGFPRLKIKVRYSVSRDKSLKARDRTELIIANYPLPKRW
ncbi:MAG: DNA adenine methylase [Planctomycetota bacterium]|jgi:DNA adenine methylase